MDICVNFSPRNTPLLHPARAQRGGTVVGIIFGILLGLCAALAVAIYVTKVPVPFVNKPPVRSAQQDQEEARKNQGWDPNAPLHQNKPAGRAAAPAPVPPAPDQAPPADKPDPVAKPPATNPTAAAAEPKPVKPAKAALPASGDPLGDLAKAKTSGKPAAQAVVAAVTPPPPKLAASAPVSSGDSVDPFTYFVQAGAFRTPEDAEGQKAKLNLMGLDARVTEREQSGRTVWRVRLGPYQKKSDADKTKERLDGSGFETALVRVQR